MGISYYVFLMGYKNLLLGVIHSLLDDNYKIKIGLLLMI